MEPWREQAVRKDRPWPGFGRGQLRHLAKLLQIARELTGDLYQLGASDIQAKVRTLVELQEFEVHSSEVLAYIARYGYGESRLGRHEDTYLINLQDHNILQCLRNEKDERGFSALMLYVLTHELLHVIRFVKFITPFHQSENDKIREEQRVHALTQKLLSKVPVRGMAGVLEKYRHLGM